jgi:hypothetical protein
MSRKSVYPIRILGVALAAVVFGISAYTQGFPWGDFRERKIGEVIAITKKAVRPDDTMFLATNVLETRAEVTFTGKSRPILKVRKFFLEWWAGMLGHGKSYSDLYDTEYLYKEGDQEYWLPTETPITKYFDKELKPNDKMVLFLISAGGYRDKSGVDCVLLVEEYQLLQNLEKVLKKSGGR